MNNKRRRKLLRPFAGSAMLVTGLTAVAVSAPPASAAHLACGSTVTASTSLASNIGPCAGDGLIVMGSNIILNLNGYRVFASNGAGDNAGVRLVGTPTGNLVKNGIVEGFDAGVLITGGGGNTVNRVRARNNINDRQGTPCDLGDGIAMLNSSNNIITSNSAIHNGPYGGISVIGDSDRNQIRNNVVKNNNVQGLPAIPGGSAGCGNPNQDEGIRIEGPGADNNVVLGNIVENSLLAGIGMHGFVCGDPASNTAPNQGTIVRGNTVSGTAGAQSAGISFLQQGPAGIVCPAFNATVKNNISRNNAGDGVFVAPNSANNNISANTVVRNGGSGIFLGGPVFSNTFTNVGPTLLDLVTPDRAPYVSPSDYQVMSGSGSGDVTARLVAIDIRVPAVPLPTNTNPADTSTSGCEQADYDAAGFMAGDVALIQRGTCTFVSKVALAIANGASAVVMFNEGQTGRTSAAFGAVGPVAIPVISTTYAVGVEMYNLTLAGPVTIHIVTNTTNEPVLRAPGAGNNTLNGNVGRDNVRFDGEDANVDCGTNNWSNNAFITVNQLCVDPDATVPPPSILSSVGPPTGRRDTVNGASRGTGSSENS